MSSSVLIFIFYRLANVLEFITGYFFMKCMDCTMKRRKGKLPFLLGLLLYTIVSTLVVFPKDMTNISFALLLFALANFTLYKGKWLVKLSMILIFLPIAASVNLLHVDIGGHIFMQFFTDKDLMANSIMAFVGFIVIPVFWVIFYRFFHSSLKKIQNIFTDKAWTIVDIISLASFSALFSCIYLAPEHKTYFIWPCILACLITNIGSVRLAAYLADGLHADLERKKPSASEKLLRRTGTQPESDPQIPPRHEQSSFCCGKSSGQRKSYRSKRILPQYFRLYADCQQAFLPEQRSKCRNKRKISDDDKRFHRCVSQYRHRQNAFSVLFLPTLWIMPLKPAGK